ncbi:hypothetical protein F5B20DRAFT_72664 [Whalleya microplaca]|nr:hypothetical protein F5B20DRAFT_72664 [Whalleya microplaca]
MVEILWNPSLGQSFSGGSSDMMDMASRFLNVNPSPGQESPRTESSSTGSPKEPGSKNGSHRAPRRAFTTAEYQQAGTPRSLAMQRRLATPSATPRDLPENDSYFQLPTQNSRIPSPESQHPSPAAPPLPTGSHATLNRPVLPGPQRSYSVMDYEPIPFTHQPGVAITLPDLPPELHYAIFDFLDPIDSTCLGLTSKHFYAIHRRMHPKVSLSARREGPNDMEWVWRNAGPFVASGASARQNSLAMLSPRGQVYCRKCRTARCELHNHIKEWVGPDMEYCEVTQKFGPAAAAKAKAFCHRSSPRHPHRCGRHTRQQRTVRLT